MHKKFEERIFNRLQRRLESQNQDILALEFDKERKLCYQNQEVPEQLRYLIFALLGRQTNIPFLLSLFVDIQDFLTQPETLSYKTVLGKNALLILKVEEALEAFLQNKRMLASNAIKIDNITIEVLARKSATNSSKITGFTVIFYLVDPQNEEKRRQLIEREIKKLREQLKDGEDEGKDLWKSFKESMEKLTSSVKSLDIDHQELIEASFPVIFILMHIA